MPHRHDGHSDGDDRDDRNDRDGRDEREQPIDFSRDGAREERRSGFRRHDDSPAHDLLEETLGEGPVIRRLLRTGKVAATVGALATILGGMGGALGWRFVGPGAEIHAMQSTVARLDTTLQRRIDSTNLQFGVRRSRDSTVDFKLDVLLRIACLNPQLSARDRKLAGLKCDG